MSIIRWIFACSFVMGLVMVDSAFAEEPLAKPKDASAREHLSQGNRLYRLREFEKAIDEYKAGALREDANVFAYNLGQCFRQLGKYEEAIWHYERFLSRAQPTGEVKVAIEDFVKQMKAELEKKAMTQKPIEPAPDVANPAPPVGPPMAVTAPAIGAAPWYADGVGWALTGTGVIVAGVGGYFLLDAADLYDQSNNEDRQVVRDELRDKASRRRTIGAIAGVGGLGLLATGIVKLALRPTANERPSTAWSIGISGNGVNVFGSF